jgi:16S rRNA processing protein RimM
VPPVKRKASQLGSNSSTEGLGSGEVRVGRLGRPHGLDGSLGLYADSGDLLYFEVGATVFVRDLPYTVRAVGTGKRGPLVSFDEVTDREAAEAIRGNYVFATEKRQLSDGEFWPDALIGLEVRPGGGVVTGVEHGVAQDRLVVRRGDDSFEVPFVHDLVPVVDIEAGFVEIVDLPGLSSPSDPE